MATGEVRVICKNLLTNVMKWLGHDSPDAIGGLHTKTADKLLQQINEHIKNDATLKNVFEELKKDKHPGLAHALSTNETVTSSLLTRPETFTNLLGKPKAAGYLAGGLNDLKNLGPRGLLKRAEDVPKRQGHRLTEEQHRIVDAVEAPIRAGENGPRVQPGFDSSRRGDEAYLKQYLAESKDKAAEIQPKLNKIAQELSELEGLKGKPGWRENPKEDTRCMDKIKEYKGDASRLVDLAGAKVEYDSIDKVYQALGHLQRTHGADIVYFKDRLVKPQESGYGDLLVNLRMSDGHIAELRLQVSSMERVADYEHRLYEVSRDLGSRAEDEGRDLTLEEVAIKAELTRRANELYQQAFREGLK